MAKAHRARKLPGIAAAAVRRGVSESVLSILMKAGGDLTEAQRIAQDLIDILPVPVFFKSRDGSYLGVNRAWEEFFGIRRDQFVGKLVQDLYPGSPWVAAEHQAMDDELWKKPGSQSYEIKIMTRPGGARSTIYHKATFGGPDGKVAGLIGTIIDVTGRKKAKRALRESEERFRQTFELAGSGIAHVDLEGRFTRVNRRLCKILGYAAEELTGRTVKEVSHPEDRDVTDRERSRLRKGELDSVHFEKRYRRKDGAAVWVDLTVALVRDTEGRPQYEIAVFDDISERKHADAALRESEARFRNLTGLSSDWYWEQDENFRFVEFSAGADLHDTSSAHVGRTRWELPGVDASEKRWAEHRETLAAHKAFRDFEFQRLTEGGEVIWISASGEPIFGEQGVFKGYRGVGSDITVRKLAEEALREQTERLQIGQKAAQMIILDRDIQNDRLTWSDSPEWLRGPLPPSGQYPLFKDQIHPEDREKFLATRAVAIESLHGQTQEFRIVRTDGQVVWLLARQKVFADASGKAKRMLVALFDITDRKRAEQALRDSEERFKSLTALSSDWYWEQDENFRFTMVSRGIEDNIGIPADQFVGKTRWETEPLGVSLAELAAHKALIEAHKPFEDFEYGRIDAKGQMHYITASGEPVFDERGRFRGYRGVGRDVTARRTAAEALRAAHDELARSNAELEQFAYVASHDLQEPLRMVSSYTQLLGKRFGERLDGDAKEFMAFIVDGAGRMKQLIEDLLAYSRVGTRGKEFRAVSLETVLRRATANLRAALEESGAAVTSDLLPEAEADESQLVQLLQNLIGNALKFRGEAPPRIHVASSLKENEWEIAVKDNGIGIEQQYFERIFMVFQRLHDKGQYPGTGIGLAICKKVVDRHGGRIWVESRPGEGSRFVFTLPRKRSNNHG